jgi:transcriptional regulator with XRE-family HTH domain
METHLGLKIRKIREIKNLDQTFLAKQLGISQSAYSEIEAGHTKISDAKLLQIAKVLGVEPNVIKNFNEAVVFNSCSQSGYINTQNINPIEKITELYEKLLLAKDEQIAELKKELAQLKKK